MLKTFQKKQLKEQLRSLRVGVIVQLNNKYYSPAVNNAKKKHTNCLKQFNTLVYKDINALTKMASNYLQARDTILKECNKNEKPELSLRK